MAYMGFPDRFHHRTGHGGTGFVGDFVPWHIHSSLGRIPSENRFPSIPSMPAFLPRLLARLPSWTGVCTGLALVAALHGQTLAFRRFDGRDGLPQSQVRVLLEDRQGFLWVGTHGGVARLGASGFKSYGIAQGLGVGRVRALLQDGAGAVWVAQTDAGLARIEGSAVRTFTAAEGLGDLNCYSLARSEERRVGKECRL